MVAALSVSSRDPSIPQSAPTFAASGVTRSAYQLLPGAPSGSGDDGGSLSGSLSGVGEPPCQFGAKPQHSRKQTWAGAVYRLPSSTSIWRNGAKASPRMFGRDAVPVSAPTAMHQASVRLKAADVDHLLPRGREFRRIGK